MLMSLRSMCNLNVKICTELCGFGAGMRNFPDHEMGTFESRGLII